MLIKIIISTLIFLSFFGFKSSAAENPDISAEGSVVINAQSGEVLFEKNAHKKMSMASTTKIMTSILAIESGKLDCTVEMQSEALTEGSSLYLKPGQQLSLETLVYGMLLESGNDAANLTALYLAGSYENFAGVMNSKASEIGMTNTNFVTASGLDDEMHFSTAYDMALLGAYAVNNPVFRKMCATRSLTVKYYNPEVSVSYHNHNRLLRECDGVFGIKTGFTKKSGRCLVTACERKGITLVCVTLNAYDDWNDHKKLFDYCYEGMEEIKISFDEFSQISIYGADDSDLSLVTPVASYYSLNKAADLERKILLPKIIYAPVYKNQKLGIVEYFSNGVKVAYSDIISAEYIPSASESYRKKNFIFKFFEHLFN